MAGSPFRACYGESISQKQLSANAGIGQVTSSHDKIKYIL
jgi:hypothetical protein